MELARGPYHLGTCCQFNNQVNQQSSTILHSNMTLLESKCVILLYENREQSLYAQEDSIAQQP